jgi:hypothetical protein
MNQGFPVIRKLGGIDAVYALLHDRIRSPDTIRMWHSRGQIPAWGMRALMELCEQKGIDYSSVDFHMQRSYSRQPGTRNATRVPQEA